MVADLEKNIYKKALRVADLEKKTKGGITGSRPVEEGKKKAKQVADL